MLQSQIDPVDVGSIHMVPEVDTDCGGHAQGRTDESSRLVVVHAGLSVDIVTALAAGGVIKGGTSAGGSCAPRVPRPVQVL